jgi:hypothetical protein
MNKRVRKKRIKRCASIDEWFDSSCVTIMIVGACRYSGISPRKKTINKIQHRLYREYIRSHMSKHRHYTDQVDVTKLDGIFKPGKLQCELTELKGELK